ncbi:hypothetical protein LRP30_05855 [Bradyrhizobium sp. C-145]|uniref:hypothetical protein n=1 Tax=Bradyrhizobium sp. C-145 TaxID=574727 RepID=UPI00201B6606|nr:hypothetical protein [Bradyrhizobium sp. C-145]UQR64828.1 hypothetical protein LRP30_05855 [Bradyrhizobium sp. C-145]
MLPLTMDELMYLARDELCGLATDLSQALASLEAGTAARLHVLASLENIRRIMVRRCLHY